MVGLGVGEVGMGGGDGFNFVKPSSESDGGGEVCEGGSVGTGISVGDEPSLGDAFAGRLASNFAV